MSTEQPNIVVFFWDNLGWGEVGCYGGGVLRGAPTPRIDALAAQGVRLLNFNVEAQCTPSRSALLTGRHPIRSGTQTVPITGGADGLTRWEVTIAQALSDAGYATGMWGKWHLGSDPNRRSPVDFGFGEAVWSPRTADEVLWTMQSYFPDGPVTATPYAGDARCRWNPSRSTGATRTRRPRCWRPTTPSSGPALTARSPTGRSPSCAALTRPAGRSMRICPTPRSISLPSPTPSTRARPGTATWPTCSPSWTTSPAASSTPWTGSASPRTPSWSGPPTTAPTPTSATRPATPTPSAASGPGSRDPGAAATSPPWRAPTAPLASSAGRVGCRPARSATSWCIWWTCAPPWSWPAAARCPATARSTASTCAPSCWATPRNPAATPCCACKATGSRRSNGASGSCTCSSRTRPPRPSPPYNAPHLHNLEWDPREEHEIGFPHGWAIHPMAAAIGAFLKSLATEPPIKPGTPDPYTPPQPGELRAEEHLQVGPITQYVTALTRSHDQLPDPHHGLEHSGG